MLGSRAFLEAAGAGAGKKNIGSCSRYAYLEKELDLFKGRGRSREPGTDVKGSDSTTLVYIMIFSDHHPFYFLSIRIDFSKVFIVIFV